MRQVNWNGSTLLKPLWPTALTLSSYCLVSSMPGLILCLIHCLQFQLLVVPLLFSNKACTHPHFIVDPLSTLLLPSSCLVVAVKWVSVGLLCHQLVQFAAVTARASTSRATHVMRNRTTTTRETTAGRRGFCAMVK